MVSFLEYNDELADKSIEELEKFFNTDITRGLSSLEAKNRQISGGYNEIPKPRKSVWKIYLSPIFNFLIVILIITSFIVIILGSPESTYVTLFMIVINSIMVIIQQYRAQKAIESLRKISALKATVTRDGSRKEIFVREIVPGDIITVVQGNKIPADGRIVKALNFTVNEAPLTGESDSIEKKEKIPFQSEGDDQVYMGTFVETGKGTILITNTGIKSKLGEISNSLSEMGFIEDIPLTRKLNRLGYILGIVVLINLFILIIYKLIFLFLEKNFTSTAISKVLASSIIRAMNVIPVNLPLLTTLIIITGVISMAKNGVIIKNLSSIESLGRVSVLCSDKTGTITQNEMTVEKFWINGKEHDLENFITIFSGLRAEIDENELYTDLTFQRFIGSLVVNNNVEFSNLQENHNPNLLNDQIKQKTLIGSGTEISLINFVENMGFDTSEIRNEFTIIAQFPFKSDLKRMTTICNIKNQNNAIILFMKGAPEIVLDYCTHFEVKEKLELLDNTIKQYILNRVIVRAQQGYRILGLAFKKMTPEKEYLREDVEKDLTFLGFVTIKDPPRFGVKQSVKECKHAGIKVIMVTGDHPTTAKTIASEVGILQDGDKELVVEGLNIYNFKGNNFLNISVFSRISPLSKEVIVEQYQEHGKVVAMTGDGINDALALKKAEIGIAMGIKGTDTAKETADMIISDDNFVSIVKGIRIGRGTFAKIRVIIYFFVCMNLMEAFIYFFYEFVPGFDLFSSNWQHIYVFTIIHGLISLPLIFDKPPINIMMEKPKDKEEILNKKIWYLLIIQAFLNGVGIVLALQLTLGGFFPLNDFNTNPALSYIPANVVSNTQLLEMKARTMFFTTLFIVETNFVWSFRRINSSVLKSFKEEFNLVLLFVCLFTLSMHFLLVIFSFPLNFIINDVMGLNLQLNFMFLSFSDWMACIALACIGLIGFEVVKALARKKKIVF
ncbi:MAG: cation-transporting P-type ATPase [Candidatus Lokiarchaeota archaeon]|nr:cation-transporting P-type ATPase [Candidatus Lokiarchaeota archaeon]